MLITILFHSQPLLISHFTSDKTPRFYPKINKTIKTKDTESQGHNPNQKNNTGRKTSEQGIRVGVHFPPLPLILHKCSSRRNVDLEMSSCQNHTEESPTTCFICKVFAQIAISVKVLS